jgi:signal transduction histidine kinase/ActR/RegA family two-component response regulator
MADETPDIPPDNPEERVLILAPRGRNAPLIAGVLQRTGFVTAVCLDVERLCEEMLQPAGAVVLAEEALNAAGLDLLLAAIGRQAPWSEIPLLVLTGGGRTTRSSFHLAKVLNPRGNVTLMERPVRILTLTTAIRAALRARRRQYELRDLLAREQAARTQAEAANKAKDHFLATLSHELRTPLNPVLMTVTSMAHDQRLPDEFREDIDVLKRNVELEARLIDDLLDLTRIARGKLELHHEAIDMHTLLRHAIEACCESDIRRKKLRLVADMHADRHHVWGDSARLTQVFWNLIKNAVKFTPEGGSITLRTEDGPDGDLLLSVTDSGIGIEPDAAERIFDAFEQGNRGITRRYGGLGLGLAICKALVELHGGTIAVQSEGRNKGATFAVRLSTTAERISRASKYIPEVDHHATEFRILVVEDHETTAEVMMRLLSSLGYKVTLARDVQSAKQCVDSLPIDLVISDLGLPDGSGLDVIRHLRIRHAIPAIAVSGYGMEDDVRDARAAGFNEHMVKPIDFMKLQGMIKRVLDGRRPRQREDGVAIAVE